MPISVQEVLPQLDQAEADLPLPSELRMRTRAIVRPPDVQRGGKRKSLLRMMRRFACI